MERNEHIHMNTSVYCESMVEKSVELGELLGV